MKLMIVVRNMDLVVRGKVIVMMMMNAAQDSFVGTATAAPGFTMEQIVAQEGRMYYANWLNVLNIQFRYEDEY